MYNNNLVPNHFSFLRLAFCKTSLSWPIDSHNISLASSSSWPFEWKRIGLQCTTYPHSSCLNSENVSQLSASFPWIRAYICQLGSNSFTIKLLPVKCLNKFPWQNKSESIKLLQISTSLSISKLMPPLIFIEKKRIKKKSELLYM